MSTALNAAAAEAAEVATFTFEFDGQEYTVDRALLIDLDVLEPLEQNKLNTAAKALLGDSQWATFRSKKRNLEDLGNLLSECFRASAGADLGESED